MTKDQWRKREAQWKKFHAWEAEHAALKLSPSERLAEIGSLVDWVLRRHSPKSESAKDLKEKVAGIVMMHHRLAALGKTA